MAEAKLAAYEQFHAKKIISADICLLSEEEKLLMPPEAKDKTPVYYVIDIVDNNDNEYKVFISSNNLAHYFTVKQTN